MVETPRFALARTLAEEFREKGGRNLVAVAVFGSVASRRERAHSDLDLLLVVRRKTSRPSAWIRRGTLVTCKELTREEAGDEVTGTHLALPEILAGWRSMRPLHDPTRLLARLIARAHRVPASQFRRSAEEGFPAVYEDLGKLRDAVEAEDRAKMREMAIWFTGGATWLLFLLNERAVSTGQEMFVEVRRLGPVGRKIATLRYRNLSIAETSRLAESIWASLRRKAGRQRIPVDDVP